MYVIKKNIGYVLDAMTEKPKQFTTRAEAQNYAEVSHMRNVTVEKA